MGPIFTVLIALGIAFLFLLAMMVAMVTMPPEWWLAVPVAFILLLRLTMHTREVRRLEDAGMEEVDRMNGYEFERFLEVFFRRMGFDVERTQYIGDWGADLVLEKEGVRIVVQAKRWNRQVGVKAVQEVVAAKGAYRCSEAMVVTNSIYTQQAVALARANGVRLWDREDLVKARLEMRREAHTIAATPSSLSGATPEPVDGQTVTRDAVCATCGKPVSEKVRQYCAEHAERFSGQVYCYNHQRSFRKGTGQ